MDQSFIFFQSKWYNTVQCGLNDFNGYFYMVETCTLNLD